MSENLYVGYTDSDAACKGRRFFNPANANYTHAGAVDLPIGSVTNSGAVVSFYGTLAEVSAWADAGPKFEDAGIFAFLQAA